MSTTTIGGLNAIYINQVSLYNSGAKLVFVGNRKYLDFCYCLDAMRLLLTDPLGKKNEYQGQAECACIVCIVLDSIMALIAIVSHLDAKQGVAGFW